jgi:cytochrome c553
MDDFLPEEKAYYLCAGCHGPETGSVLYPMPHDIPTIIGQKKEYLLKQLIAYRDGHREHPNMSGVLGNYTDQNLANLAEYYQNLGPKRPERKAPAHAAAPAIAPGSAAIPPTHAQHHHKKKAMKAKASSRFSSNTKTP